jgi:hypothetical protein
MDHYTTGRHNAGSIPSAPYRELEENRISPDEYAERVRREVEEAVRESPPPARERRRSQDDEPPRHDD